MKETKLVIPIIIKPISFLVYSDPKEFIKKFPELEFSHDPESFQGGVFKVKDTIYMALLNDGSLTYGMIAHESKHMINRSFDFIGYKLDSTNDEMECYFLEWVMDEVLKVIKLK